MANFSRRYFLGTGVAGTKKVASGKTLLWNYRGTHVVFEDGKVTDVKF